MNIRIDASIRDKWPEFHVAAITMSVRVYENPFVTELIESYQDMYQSEYDITDVVTMPIIKDGRDAYKAFGKDPSRYRLAVESLIRRIVKGNTLYRINNVVDIGNVLSLEARKSVAVLDKERISVAFVARAGGRFLRCSPGAPLFQRPRQLHDFRPGHDSGSGRRRCH